ncbi:uncharacterized protein [Rutidosis leptorrhynchoides]|uniref:uncharacterized protein n=1 Tax=Rutidosis leptorrhynchoides TaxID=125765 RepID=UPI003A9A4E8E
MNFCWSFVLQIRYVGLRDTVYDICGYTLPFDCQVSIIIRSIMSGCKVADRSDIILATIVGVHTKWGLLMSSISKEGSLIVVSLLGAIQISISNGWNLGNHWHCVLLWLGLLIRYKFFV